MVSAKPEQLIAWDKLVGVRRIDFDRAFASNASIDVQSTLQLGASIQLHWRDGFYAQSAMLARYLYDGEDSRYRRALLEFVAAYYTGATDRLDFQKAFGVSADELGPKIVRYAAALLE